MAHPLTACEGRVVASLVEKQLTIPQHYPLTLGALLAACNQSSNRDPVTAYGEHDVLDAVESLKKQRLLRAVLPSHGRSVVRYRHVLDETLGLDASQLAVLAVLELRGAQTVAELRARTERMAAIDSVDHELELLSARDDPLVQRAGRRPGQKEDRWMSLLAEPPAPSPEPRAGSPAAEPAAVDGATLAADVGSLRDEVVALRREVESLRASVEELRDSLGG